jgi:hypothetical protein
MQKIPEQARSTVSSRAGKILTFGGCLCLLSSLAGLLLYICVPSYEAAETANFLLNFALRSAVLSVAAGMILDLSDRRK